RGRRRRLSPGREVRRRVVLRPAGEAGADRARRRGHPRLRAALVRRTGALARPRAGSGDQYPRLDRARRAGRARPGAGRARPAPVPARVDDRHQRPLGQLDGGRLPVACLGASVLSRAVRGRGARTPVARALDAARFDAVHLEGPGTDLTLGLLPSSTWQMARWETAGGIRHLPNVPTEEVFTTPDPERVDGHVRSTRPLV